MESNDDNSIKAKRLLKYWQENLLSKINFIQNIDEYYQSIDKYEIFEKISTLFLLKLIEDNNELSEAKIKEIKTILDIFKNSPNSFEELFIKESEDPILQNIDNIFELFNANICYSYMSWKFMKIFGENSQNFMEFFQIVSKYYDKEIEFEEDFPYDEKYFINISNYLINNLKSPYYDLLNQINDEQNKALCNNYYLAEKIEDINTERVEKNFEENNENERDCGNAKEEKKEVQINRKRQNKKKAKRKTLNLRKARNRMKNDVKIKNGEDEENEIEKKSGEQNGDKKYIVEAEKDGRNEEKFNKKDDNINENIKKEDNATKDNEFSINKSEGIDKEERSKENDIIKEKELIYNLKPKENLRDYFKRIYNHYNINKFRKKNYYLYDLANNKYFPMENKFLFKKDYDKFPFVSNMFTFLIEQLKPVKDTNNNNAYKEYHGPESFGYLVLDGIEYFYVFQNEYNRELFNDINRVKEYEYKNAFLGIPCSRNLNLTGNEHFNFVESHFLSSNDFEPKINNYFKKYNLKELPNYFFRIKEKNKKLPEIKYEKNINMNYAEFHYFLNFVETDGAYVYNDSSPMTIIDKNNKLFKLSKTIKVSSYGKKITLNEDENNDFAITNNVIFDKSDNKIKVSKNDDFIINQNSVILIEDKLNISKIIENFDKNKKMNKDELYSSFNFLIYKTIRKIRFYEEYLTSISEKTNNKYSYYLLLVYYNNPISDIENIIIKILKNLSSQSLIKYPSFQLKVIYSLPCISFNNSKEFNDLKAEVKILKEKVERMEMLLNEKGIKI